MYVVFARACIRKDVVSVPLISCLECVLSMLCKGTPNEYHQNVKSVDYDVILKDGQSLPPILLRMCINDEYSMSRGY